MHIGVPGYCFLCLCCVSRSLLLLLLLLLLRILVDLCLLLLASSVVREIAVEGLLVSVCFFFFGVFFIEPFFWFVWALSVVRREEGVFFGSEHGW